MIAPLRESQPMMKRMCRSTVTAPLSLHCPLSGRNQHTYVDLRYLDAKPRRRSALFLSVVGRLLQNHPRRLAHSGTGGRRGPARLFSGAAALGAVGRVDL